MTRQKKIAVNLLGGYPNDNGTKTIISSIIKYGIDIIEITIPFMDPFIEDDRSLAMNYEAAKTGWGIGDALRLVNEKADGKEEFILCMYANQVLNFGIQNLAKECQENKVSGIRILDVPMEEEAEFKTVFKRYNIKLIRNAAHHGTKRYSMILTDAEDYLLLSDDQKTKIETKEGVWQLINVDRKNEEQIISDLKRGDGIYIKEDLIDHLSNEDLDRYLSYLKKIKTDESSV